MKNLLNISSLTKNDFYKILDFSKILKKELDSSLIDKHIGLIFEKNSTRTRLSFQVGIRQLQGNYIDIKLEELNLNRFESYEDTFEVMSCYLDCIVFRTTDHQKLELALKYFDKPVINALSDISHPCQAIADIFTLEEHFGSANNLNIVWMGDINNVLFSLIETLAFLNNTFIDVFTHESIFKKYENFYKDIKNIRFHFDLDEDVISKSNCIMTDVFNSMNDSDDKEVLLKKFQVNKQIMSLTNKNAVFMHCLPAKIGSEVTKEVIKSPQSITLKQAHNRMVTQRGILKWLDL